MYLDSLSGLCTDGILSDSDGHGLRSQLSYNWQRMPGQTRTGSGSDSKNIPDQLLV